jgi:hypothetical protein
MPVPFDVTIIRNGQPTRHMGAIEDRDWAVLREFAAEAQRLSDAPVLRREWSVRFRTTPTGFALESPLPPEMEVHDLLHRLRPFVLQHERTQYGKVHGILWRVFAAEDFRELLATYQARWSGRDSQDLVRVEVADRVINSEHMFLQWMNGTQWHRDEDKRAIVEAVGSTLSYNVLYAIMVDQALAMAEAVLHVGRLVIGVADSPTARKGASPG